jgi:hypothetical protein
MDKVMELLQEYKAVQQKMDVMFRPILKKHCKKCKANCCHKTIEITALHKKLLELDGVTVTPLKRKGKCDYLGRKGCKLLGLKPYHCEVHSCADITNTFVKDGKIGKYNLLRVELSTVYKKLGKEV